MMSKVCDVKDISPGNARRISVDGIPVAVVHTGEGEYHAMNDICSHQDVSLAEGFVEGCALECIGHGSLFDLKTGMPENLPATDPVAVYKCEVNDGSVYVDTDVILNEKEMKA